MKIFFTAIITFLLLMSEAQAAKIDSYREIISSGRFTIKYTLTEPPARVTNKEATLLSGFFGSDFQMTNTSAVQIRDLNNHTGALVFDGNNKYIENLGKVVLKKNGENFRFFIYQKPEKIDYRPVTGYKREVIANNEEESGTMNALDVLKEDFSYGTLATALAPIIPPDKIIVTPLTPQYKFIGSGTLGDGTTYEDYFGSKNSFNCAIRYYFNGDALTKIAVFDYSMSGSRVQNYEKYLVQINEFSATPDQNYLKLPAELKDKTKRDKGAKK